jgi:glutamine amidotransferase
MSKINIAVVDYGMGNLRSVSKALEHVAPTKNVLVTSNPDDIAQAERVVFPGQGAMPDCIRELDARGLREAVIAAAVNKPFLGICIGLQMLFEHSEEGDAAGLGVFKGNVKRFAAEDMLDSAGAKLKVPHMGWNQVYQTGSEAHALWHGIEDGARFYYVHSYYAEICEQTTAVCDYIQPFSAAMQKDNFYATQFHPEKSADIGEQILLNFLEL